MNPKAIKTTNTTMSGRRAAEAAPTRAVGAKPNRAAGENPKSPGCAKPKPAARRARTGSPEPARVSLAQLRAIKPEELVTFRVSLLAQLITRMVEESVSRPLDLSSRQWRVMMMLNRLGPSTSGQIASVTPLDHSQVSRVSYELVDKGLMAMTADPDDRRKQTLELTAAGTDLLRRGMVKAVKRQQRLQGCLPPEDYAVFNRALITLIAETREMLIESSAAG